MRTATRSDGRLRPLSELYDAEYYHEHLGDIPYSRSEPHWIRYFGDVADNIVATIAPRDRARCRVCNRTSC